MSLSSEYSILASVFFNNVNDGSWKIYAILAVTSSGTEVVITDRTGRQMIVLITDRKSLGASQILGADGVTLAAVKTTAPVAADPGLVVRLNGGLATGFIGTIQIANSQTLANVTNITNPVAVKFSVNAALINSNEVAVAAAVATLVVSASPGDQVVLRNDDATNVAWVGASGVTTGAGYKLVAGEESPLMILSAAESFYAIGDGVNPINVSFLQYR